MDLVVYQTVTIAHTEAEVVAEVEVVALEEVALEEALEVGRLQLLLSRQLCSQEPHLSSASHSTGLRLRYLFSPLQALILPVLQLSSVLHLFHLLGHLPVV